MSKKIVANTDLKPSPTAKLTEREGTRIIGTLKKKLQSTLFEGKMSYLITAEDTDARTVLWDKEQKAEVEVDIEQGDAVFVQGTTALDRQLAQVAEGSRVEIIYTGKGTASKRGRKPPYLFDVIDHSVEA